MQTNIQENHEEITSLVDLVSLAIHNELLYPMTKKRFYIQKLKKTNTFNLSVSWCPKIVSVALCGGVDRSDKLKKRFEPRRRNRKKVAKIP